MIPMEKKEKEKKRMKKKEEEFANFISYA